MEIRSAAVIGNGTMGSGIARQIAVCGTPVILYGRNMERVQKAYAGIEGALERQVAKGKTTAEEKAAVLSRIRLTDCLEDVKDADIVIEAIAEDLALKQEFFTKLEEICREDAILATNTSALSVTAIASPLKNRGRVIGLHFFNPVSAMKLVEIVMGDETTEETYAAARAFCEGIGRECVRLNRSTPGFIVNRVLFAYFLECVHIYEEGIASKEDIDTAIRFGLNHPLGPFKLMDMGGLDTFPSVCASLQAVDEDRFRCPDSVKKLAEEGKFGPKSGEGWYKYN